MLGFILYLLLIGLVAGFVARLLVPGKDPMGIAGTILLGVVGSFIGGFLGWALFGKDLSEGALQPSGVIGTSSPTVMSSSPPRSQSPGDVSSDTCADVTSLATPSPAAPIHGIRWASA